MKQKIFLICAATLILGGTTLSAFAADNHAALLGQAAAPATANRTIIIGPDTAYVNVTRGDVVKFVVGDKTFAWNFGGPSTIGEIELNAIAPPGILNHTVKAYIKRNLLDDGA